MNCLSHGPNFQGAIKIWKTDIASGQSELLISKPNTVLYGGADILADALAGKPASRITHFYVGFANDVGPIDAPPVIKDNSDPMTQYSGDDDPDRGYLRLPLAFTPSFLNSDSDYDHNIAVFSVQVTSAAVAGGNSATFGNGSRLFELAMVAGASDPSRDRVFARVQFNEITFNDSSAFTATWGVKFTA